MIHKDKCLKKVREFKIKYGLDASDENVITTIHLMNSKGLEQNAAKDQSSRSGNDHGIDGWHYDEKKKHLTLFQSKLSESKAMVLSGINDLKRASEWLENILIDGLLERIPVDNHMLYGLYVQLSKVRTEIQKIAFVLLSLFDENELEDDNRIDQFNLELARTRLNEFMRDEREGTLQFRPEQFALDTSVPNRIKLYEIQTLENSRVQLRTNSFLQLSYVSLFSLIELYRQRGDVLFDKNVRLSLLNTKEVKGRLLHPLFDTLDSICSGVTSASIFPFFHIGVTISATRANEESGSLFALESPSVINGCQTITLSHEYLKRIEQTKDESERSQRMANFKKIQVIAKVVVGVSDDELKDITNANNRQNPIENWQLFSNDSIHVSIETVLRDKGIFYERQKGKFDSVMKIVDNVKNYPNTNGTFIKVEQLGQLISLAKKDLQFAAKPSLIFESKKNHDAVYANGIDRYPRDMIFLLNVLKALTRGLQNYLTLPSHAENTYTQRIFVKPIVKISVFHLGLMYYYQHVMNVSIRQNYHKSLNKKAPPTIVEDTTSYFYPKIISKIKNWYLEESNKLEVEVSTKKMDAFFSSLFLELKLDIEGPMPFSSKSHEFSYGYY